MLTLASASGSNAEAILRHGGTSPRARRRQFSGGLCQKALHGSGCTASAAVSPVLAEGQVPSHHPGLTQFRKHDYSLLYASVTVVSKLVMVLTAA